jgi:hypothetical protein
MPGKTDLIINLGSVPKRFHNKVRISTSINIPLELYSIGNNFGFTCLEQTCLDYISR